MAARRNSAVLDELSEVLGRDQALALCWEFRGERTFVPRDHRSEPKIEAAIGKESAEKFCQIFGGTTVPFPFAIVIEERVSRLAAQSEPRLTKREIGRLCQIPEARVYAILARQAKAAKGG